MSRSQAKMQFNRRNRQHVIRGRLWSELYCMKCPGHVSGLSGPQDMDRKLFRRLEFRSLSTILKYTHMASIPIHVELHDNKSDELLTPMCSFIDLVKFHRLRQKCQVVPRPMRYSRHRR